MSRSGYSDDIETWDLIRWRGAVTSAIRGARGQKLLTDLLAALDAMPEKRLIAEELVADGEHCALGVLGAARGLDMSNVDPEDSEAVAKLFDIAPALASEIVFHNDETWYEAATYTPEKRWDTMRQWVAEQITRPETGVEFKSKEHT